MAVGFRLVLKFLAGIVLVGVLYINWALYHKPVFRKEGKASINADVLAELRFLKAEVHRGAAEDMQEIFPEGYVFLYALYGLAWCEIAADLDRKSALYQEAHTEIQFAYDHVASDAGRSIFSEYQILPYGAFYNGWSNYLLAKKLGLESPRARNAGEVAQFKTRCKRIVQALADQESPYLTSYPGSAWPADVVMCIASLSAHDKLFAPVYQREIEEWLTKVKNKLDTRGLIPHKVHPKSGAALEQARGCSQSLMLCFLPAINEDFSREQYALYHKLFLDSLFGLPGIREYVSGEFGLDDVDSGPRFMQMGSVASIVGIRALRVNGGVSESTMLRTALEPFALPFERGDTKNYFLGQMPMADAFLAWVQAAGRADDKIEHAAWRLKFHGYSLVVILVPVLGYWYWKTRTRRKNLRFQNR